MPLVNTSDKRKKFPKRHTYSVTINSLRPGIVIKESKISGRNPFVFLSKARAVIQGNITLVVDCSGYADLPGAFADFSDRFPTLY
jgi:hypothetical protein